MKHNRMVIAGTCVLIAFSMVFSSCMTVELESDSATPVIMSGAPNRDYAVVRSFEVAQRGWFSLFDLVTITNPAVQKAIDAELTRAGGDAVINVKLVGQTTFVDGLIPVGMTVAGTLLGQALAPDPLAAAAYGSLVGSVAGAMLSARTYTVCGDVIRYRD